MFIPLKDLNPSRTYPFVNITLIFANVVILLYQVGLEATLPRRAFDALLLSYSTVPARFPAYLAGHVSFEVSFVPLLTSMFLHAGLLHLAGNMLFLWIFGDNVEDRLGRVRFVLFYFFCGAVAFACQLFVDPESPLPMLGASGAIAGVLGAYLVLFPRARVLTLVPIFILAYFVELPAWVFLIVWFVFQNVAPATLAR